MCTGPGMSGWGMTFMIIGNLILWGLLIFGAVLVARYVRPAQTALLGANGAIESRDTGLKLLPVSLRTPQPNETCEPRLRHVLGRLPGLLLASRSTDDLADACRDSVGVTSRQGGFREVNWVLQQFREATGKPRRWPH